MKQEELRRTTMCKCLEQEDTKRSSKDRGERGMIQWMRTGLMIDDDTMTMRNVLRTVPLGYEKIKNYSKHSVEV